MSENPFTPAFDSLPGTIPVFPLAGVLLLPSGKMPLNIFERRYLAMTRAALADPFRLIGMIQPTGHADGPNGPELFQVGCAGRLISFAETDDGRYLITLDGLCRFRTKSELPLHDGFRRFEVDWSPYRADMEDRGSDRAPISRTGIATAAEAYFRGRNMSINGEALRKLGDRELVTALSMGCPFTPEEKQALLEASDLAARAKLLETLFAMGANEPLGDGEATRH
ncbi:MAG: LON peptidase substrate-binding domain-containing protein [Gemmatimonas sp.]